MANRTTMESKSKFDGRDVARSWLARGIRTVPLEEASKRPAGGMGWNNLRVEYHTIDNHFRPHHNVGGLWGLPSDWRIDIDLDWDESVAAAKRLLPRTMTYGRASRPRSHYIYRCVDAKGSKRMAPDGSVIVELRSTGTQSVLPPSMHPDKERYQIDDDTIFTELSPTQLERLINRVAACALLARCYPAEGSRHDYVHAVTGMLLHDGWNESLVLDFMWGLLDAVGPLDDDRNQRERTIQNTIAHFHQGDKVYGFKMLTNWLNLETRDRIQLWLKADRNFGHQPRIVVATPADQKPELLITPQLLQVGGLIGDIAAWSAHRAYLKQPVFDLAVGLTCVALLSGNRYLVDAWDTPLQPYFMLLAPTAGGKESALNSVAAFAKKIQMHEHVFQGFQSQHAMLDALVESPHIACWLWDEAARKLRAAAGQHTSPDNQVVTWLMSLYGRANSFSPAYPGRHQSIPSIDNPFLITLAASQPSAIVEAINQAQISTGLVNRFILIDAGDEAPEDNFARVDVFPARILEQCKKFKEVSTDGFKRIPFDSEKTFKAFQDFQTETRKRSAMDGSNEMWGRANQNALILAGLLAISDDPARPSISMSHTTWATELSRWSVTRWTGRLNDMTSRTRTEDASRSVERYITHAKAYADKYRVKKPKFANLLAAGFMPRTVLVRLARHLTARELNEVLTSLQEADLISVSEKDGNEVYVPR